MNETQMRTGFRASTLGLLVCGALTLASGCPRRAPDPHGHDGHGSSHGPLGHRFDDPERWSKRWDDPARDAWQRPAEILALLAVPAGGTVADLGTGTGYFLPHLSVAVGAAGRVLALDVEPAMVRHVAARAARDGIPNVEARVVPFDDPALLPATVDRILVVNTWHHIPDRATYARKLAAALRPGGAVLVVDYTLEAEEGPPRAERIAPDVVAAELAAGGLRAEVLAEGLPRQYAVIARTPGL